MYHVTIYVYLHYKTSITLIHVHVPVFLYNIAPLFNQSNFKLIMYRNQLVCMYTVHICTSIRL